MKVLFALNQNPEKTIEDSILNYYKELTGTSFEYVKEYDLIGVSKRLKLENFDLLVLNEELEKDNHVTATFLDDITDTFSNFRIILIVNSEHEKDNYIKKVFNIGAYDVLYSSDISFENIVKLMVKGRTKAEAKIYLDLHDIEDASVENELKYIPEQELDSILDYFSSIEAAKVNPTFEHINKQYNEEQMIFLIKHLPSPIKDLLSTNPRYIYLNNILESRTVNIPSNETEVSVNKQSKSESRAKPFIKIELPQRDTSKQSVKIVQKNQYIHINPNDYVKYAGFVGAAGKGKSLIIDLIARCLTSNGIDVSVIDITQDNSFYYKYIWGNENVKEKNKNSITNLLNNIQTPYKVNKHYSLYSEPNLPITIDILEIVDKLKMSSKVILIDMDFCNGFIDLSKYILSNIFIVHDLDILDLNKTKNLLLNLMNNNVNPAKFCFVINKYVKCSVTSQSILNMFENPISEIENENDVGYLSFKDNALFSIDFDKQLYINYLNTSYLPEKEFTNSDKINQDIFSVANHIYSLPSPNSNKSIMKRLFKKQIET